MHSTENHRAATNDARLTPGEIHHRTIIQDMVSKAPNRRRFVQKLGMAGLLAGALSATRDYALNAQTATITDVDILNFALNLEYLEAEFYTVATLGSTLATTSTVITGAGASGGTSGGAAVTFTDSDIRAIAQELAEDERDHVTLLQGAISGLGGQPVAKPAIDLGALGFGFGSQKDFLVLARIFEDIGVTAYGGAAPLITDKTILGYAARILATEAEHAGNIRAQVARFGLPTLPLDAVDHTPPPSGTRYFSVDNNALTEVRTPGQVLYLAYAAANASGGGFFPNGVNGNIKVSSTAATATASGMGLSASPNPIPVAAGGSVGMTTITWNAPGSTAVEIHLLSPSGPLFANGNSSGSAATGAWVSDGLTFFLQDVTGGKPLTAANTIATLTLRLQH